MGNTKKATVLRLLFCDFCGKSQEQCDLLVKGRDSVHICIECIEVCREIVAEHRALSVVEPAPARSLAVDPCDGSTPV